MNIVHSKYNMLEYSPMRKPIPIPVLFLITFIFTIFGCRTSAPPVPQEFVNAAIVLEQSVDVVPKSDKVSISGGKLEQLRETISDYRLAVSEKWNDKVIPLLRVAYGLYEELRAAGVNLPKLPDFVVDLVKCSTTPKPPEPPPSPVPSEDAGTV